MRRTTAVTGVFATALFLGFTGSAQAADLDCGDFASQAEAQANLDANPTDPNGLDADNDGEACETFAYASGGSSGGSSGGQVTTVPTGSVAAGDGSAAADRTMPYALGGMTLAAAGGAALVARRKARSTS